MAKDTGRASGPAADFRPMLLAADIKVILQLLPRAQIVVGDTPVVFPILQRLNNLAQMGVDLVVKGSVDGEKTEA